MSQIRKIGVIGAGNMGSGIVQKIAQEGIDVVMVDTKKEFVERGLNTIRKTLQEGVERNIFRMVLRPRSTNSTFMSTMTTTIPSWAIFWTMPLPILPAPNTPNFLN